MAPITEGMTEETICKCGHSMRDHGLDGCIIGAELEYCQCRRKGPFAFTPPSEVDALRVQLAEAQADSAQMFDALNDIALASITFPREMGEPSADAWKDRYFWAISKAAVAKLAHLASRQPDPAPEEAKR